MEVKGKTAVAVEIDNKELVRALKYKVYTDLSIEKLKF